MSFPGALLIPFVPGLNSFGQEANQGHVLAVRKLNQRIHPREDGAAYPIPDMRSLNPSVKTAVTTSVLNKSANILTK
jgi:hypothetical protein